MKDHESQSERVDLAPVDDGSLEDLSLAGTGTLADVIGAEKAKEFFDELEATRRYLYEYAVARYGRPAINVVLGRPPARF
ncbi:MAG TPA: hypothetical protein VMR34_03595 [Candidatus Saccharimonadales bacterium]|nr:hypothetical protein [Candidatus Saccharimonadales bacterium]